MAMIPTVLVVDDDDVFRSVVEAMVQTLGYPVMKACDGIEAIKIFQEHANEIGCIVLDIQMPRMNGIMTFQHLKEMRDNVRVIIASGYLDDTNLEKLDPLQPVGYLQKPVFFETLSDLLTECCSM